MRNLKYIMIVLSLLLSVQACSVNNDFDRICGYFDNLEQNLVTNSLTYTQRSEFISNLVSRELSAESHARAAWEVILYAEPRVRYELFKTAAEETTKQTWHCKAMEKLIETTGE